MNAGYLRERDQQHSKQLALGQRAGGVDPRTVCRAVAGSQTLVSPPLDDRTAREPRRVWGWPPHADASGYSDRSECRTPIGLEQTMTPFERGHGPCSSFAPVKRATIHNGRRTKIAR